MEWPSVGPIRMNIPPFRAIATCLLLQASILAAGSLLAALIHPPPPPSQPLLRL